jgi:hypothetical protein
LSVASGLSSHAQHVSEAEAYCGKTQELSVAISGMMNSYLADPQVDYRKVYLLTRVVDALFGDDEVYWNKVTLFVEAGIDELQAGKIKHDIPYLIYAVALCETAHRGANGKVHSFFENFMANTFDSFNSLHRSEIYAVMAAE